MTRYFVHLRQGSQFILDEEGKDYADLTAARAEAIQAGREMVSEMIMRGDVVDDGLFEIWTIDGELVDTISLSSVIKLKS